MSNKYEKDIIQILKQAGNKGLSVKKIALNVFNYRAGLFETVAFETVHSEIKCYLVNATKRKRHCFIVRRGRGIYQLDETKIPINPLNIFD